MSRHPPKKAEIRRRPTHSLNRLRLEAGEAVYDKGDSSTELYRVVSGKVDLSLPRRHESMKPVELGAGAIFGQAGLFTGAARRESAVAATEAVLDVMPRQDALELLEGYDETTRKLLAELFDRAQRPNKRAPEENSSGAAADGIQSVRLLLKPASRPLAAWIGREPIEITRLPFVVGRLGEGEDENEDDSSSDHVDLVLDDEKPYQLSRRHFAIETCDGELVVRDSGSYHGTTVNSQRIGDDRGTSMVPLRIGENSIIAGSTDSPYRFTLLIEAA